MSETAAAVVAPVAVPKRTLVAKLAEVMGEVDRVKKTGHNNFHNYDYATEADIVESVRHGLAARGVMLFSNPVEVVWGVLQGQKGTQRLCTLKVEFTFEDGESGETKVLYAYGEGSDGGDKAMYKALTGAVKYLLLKTFLIPTGDDPEADAPVASKPAPQERPAPSSRVELVKQKLAATSRMPITDVQGGETEAQAKAREAKASADLKQPTPYERIVILCGEYGVADKAIGSTIKGATGKPTAKALTLEDVAKVHATLEILRKAKTHSDNSAEPMTGGQPF